MFCAKEAEIPIKCYSPELMVQPVYSIEVLDVILKEERGLLGELERYKRSSDLSTDVVDEQVLSNEMEKLEQSDEKQRHLEQCESSNEDRFESTVDRLEGKLQQVRNRKGALVDGIVETITKTFPFLHCLCIGPGLGRHVVVFNAMDMVIRKAIDANLALVLDADALFMLSMPEYNHLLDELRQYDKCVMTPNVMELRRLTGTSNESEDVTDQNISIQKGSADAISHGVYKMQCEEVGGLKRSGGIGDVLAGTTTAFMAWNSILSKTATGDQHQQQRILAAWAASCVVKTATKQAFQKKRRAMSAMDVSEQIGVVLESMESSLELP